METSDKDYWRQMLEKIVVSDYYDIKKFSSNRLDAILDIGAHEGVFSLMSRFLFPKAYVIAIEPSLRAFSRLEKNLSQMPNISWRKAALGKTGIVFLDSSLSYSTENISEISTTGETVVSWPLASLARRFLKKKRKYFLKIDCEGAETSIMGDEDSESAIRKSAQTTIEVHFGNDYLRTLPSPEGYKQWAVKTFPKHKVVFDCQKKSTARLRIINRNRCSGCSRKAQSR